MPRHSKEQDPLLPKDSGAPEVDQGSRPPSIENVYVTREEVEKGVNQQARKRLDMLFFVLLKLCFVVGLGLILLSTFFREHFLGDSKPRPDTLEERVNRILSETPLIDGHNDLAILIRFLYNNRIYEENFTTPFELGGMPGEVDLPRLKAGKNGGAFWSAYVPCPANGSDFSDENYAESVAFTLAQIDVLTRLQSAYPTHFSLPPNSSTALAAFKSGLLISPLAIEGLHQIGNSLSNLRLFHSLGVRYATLTHNCHNIYADAALLEIPGGTKKATPYWGGISPAGKQLIQEMNRMGMIVDLSHVSVAVMRDVLGGSEGWAGSAAPVIYSHSSAYSVCPHPRNVPDEILYLVKKTNSVVLVNFAPDFISCVENPESPVGLPDTDHENATLQQVVKHIKYIGDLVGYEHVGLGSDFDGIPSTPEGLDDVSKFPDLVGEMLKQGITDEQASMVVGGNVLRVWAEVDKVAEKMQREGVKPVEDKLPSFGSPY